MTVKEYLSQPYKIEQKIKYLYRELERYERMIGSVPSPQYDVERVDKSPSNESPNMKSLIKYYETKDMITQKEKEQDKIVEEITLTIDKLDKEEYKSLLKYRYIDFLQFVDIEERLYVSYATIKRWHNNALSKLQLIKDEPR